MVNVWHIEGYDSGNLFFECNMPGNLSEPEIETTLQRLVAGYLSEDEVVSASLRKNAKGYRSLLKRVGEGMPIHYGENPYFIASPKDV